MSPVDPPVSERRGHDAPAGPSKPVSLAKGGERVSPTKSPDRAAAYGSVPAVSLSKGEVSLSKGERPVSLAKTPVPTSTPRRTTALAAPNPTPDTPVAPAPGWYPDPGDPSRNIYWDGVDWQPVQAPPAVVIAPPAGPAPHDGDRERRSWVPIIWIVGVAVVVAVIGSMLVSGRQHSTPAVSSAPSRQSDGSDSSTGPLEPSGPGLAVPRDRPATPSDRIDTGSPRYPSDSAPDPIPVVGTIAGTCDEGGTCGVKRRAQPYTAAPRLHPNDLQDGMTVTVSCETNGDLRSSEGHGSSTTWYRLDDGSYVNSVYMDVTATRIPAC